MKKTTFSIVIDATREKVWHSLFDDAGYRAWTKPFAETSFAETTWEKGSKALFLDEKRSGMVSVIAENIPYEYMSVKHIGEMRDGIENLETAKEQGWSGAEENYLLKTVDGKTELTIQMDSEGMSQQMLDYFMDKWPVALDLLKAIAERG